MADLTYKQALAANELVPGAPGAGQEQITGGETVGATSATDADSGFTFDKLKAWIKLDADWMSKSAYDSDGDGNVNAAESLNDGAGNAKTAAEVAGHIDNAAFHFPITDGSTAANVAWSGQYINAQLNAIVQFPEAPIDGEFYSRKDGAWDVSPRSPVGGLFLYYNWSTNTANSDPGSGNMKGNNSDFKLATALYVSATTRAGNSAVPIWSQWKQGDYVTVQHDADGTFNAYQISGPIVDNTSWFSIPVTPIPGGTGTLANGAPITSTQVLTPQSRVPNGGTIGQALVKSSNTDWDVGWGDVGDVVGAVASLPTSIPVFADSSGKVLSDSGIVISSVVSIGADNQFAGLLEKVSPVGTDLLLLEDSAVGGAKRKVQVANLPTGGGGSGHIIQDEGIALPARTNLNFVGATVTAQDNLGNDATDVNINAIDGSGVTFENLDANGDVGTGAAQVAQGDHNHSGLYLEEAPVDNLAYTRQNSAWARGSRVYHQAGDPVATAQIGDVWIPV